MNDDQTRGAAAQTATDDTTGAVPSEAVDSQGTDAESARAIIREVRDKGFSGSDEKFAVALGRPTAEVTALISGDETVDDDVVMKVRGIAQQRGIEISQ